MKSLDEYASRLGENASGVKDLRKLFGLLKSYGIDDWCEFDPSVVRGLAYYTGVVFEGFDRSRELRAICGGGRYDKLFESFGGTAVPAVGFGFGDAVIVELLKMKNLLPEVTSNPVDCLAFAMKGNLQSKMIPLVQNLRHAGCVVDMVLEEKKPKWVFQRADKLQIRKVIVFGEDEDAQGEVTIKDIRTGVQTRCKYEEVVNYIQSNL
jgi:histidyl-tRNA synthetase